MNLLLEKSHVLVKCGGGGAPATRLGGLWMKIRGVGWRGLQALTD